METSVLESPTTCTGQPSGAGLETRKNLLEEWKNQEITGLGATLELVRLDENQTAIVAFTTDGVKVKLHFLDCPDLKSYVRCNGADCLLCQIGNKADERNLLPVYLPTQRCIGLLPISSSMRPGSLKPQLLPMLEGTEPKILLIRRADRSKYEVTSASVAADMDLGKNQVEAFMSKWNAKQIALEDVYPQYTNGVLAQFTSVEAMMKIKGIKLNDKR